jgi:hypothetical protein
MTLRQFKYFFLFIIITCFSVNSYSQADITKFESLKLHLEKPPAQKKFYSNQNTSASLLPISIGIAAVLYLINPILIYEDKKLYAGLTKELSLGWGKLGEHRTAFEYSLIIGGRIRHFIRFSYKYDFLLNKDIQPSHMLQGTGVLSFGGGYFTDFDGNGLFPEITWGYSLRNHKLLFYPHVKLRHTFMLKKDKSDITDISFGLMIGIANPFINVPIRRKY